MLQRTTKPNKHKHVKWNPLFLALVLMISSIAVLPASKADAAAPLKISYNNKTINFTGQQVSVKLDGKTLYMDKTPGLELISNTKEEIYMVSAVDVFQKGMGASYKKSGSGIVIKKNDITIKMTVGSKTAYVNNVKKTLPYAPVMVKYFSAGKIKLLVPAKFTAEALGCKYTWKNNSSTSGTISITSPYSIFYSNKWHVYKSSKGKVTYNGVNVDVSNMNSVIIDNTAMLQAKKVFADSPIKAKYGYNSTDKTVTLVKNDTTVVMTLGSKTAYVNGVKKTMTAAPQSIKTSDSNKSYIMIPGQFTAQSLGYRYSWNAGSATSEIMKGDCKYFDWYVGDGFVWSPPASDDDKILPAQVAGSDISTNPAAAETTEFTDPSATPLPTLAPEISPSATPSPTPEPVLDYPNYVQRVEGSFYQGKDTITVTTYFDEEMEITDDETHVYIRVPNTVQTLQDQTFRVPEIVKLKGVTIDTLDDSTMITLERTANAPYSAAQDGNTLVITFAPRTIKIAVDCGHGSNTPGKRTPPLPFDIDFDNDGIIDVKKGRSINEHTADVGIGKYLATELERCGFEVYRSAFGDEDVPLAKRQSNMREANADYSVSIHFNAIGDGRSFNGTSGAGVFYHSVYPGDSKALANIMLKHILKGTPQRSIGVNGAHSFAVNNTSATGTKASILIECAFMTNLDDVVNMMANDAYWKETAQEIAQGFCEYTGMPYVPE